MNILLIATNRQGRYMHRMMVQPLPLGVAYLASHIDPARHRLQVLDLMFVDDALAAAEKTIRAFQPELIGLSLRNLDNQSYLHSESVLPLVRDLVARIRTLTSAPVVCGGPAFSILPRECFEYLRPDLGIAGDAEATLAQLADCLADGADYRNLPGLVYRQGETIVVQGNRAAASFSKPPRLDLLDVKRYRQAGFGIGVITKLSRVNDPSDKGAGEASGQAWRIRPIPEVLQELRQVEERHQLRRIFFIDSGFNIPLPYAKDLCRALHETGLPLRWNTYLRAGPCDDELTKLMKQSGCTLILLAGTPTSGGQGALDEQLQQIGQLCAHCKAGGLPFTLSLTFGDPGENQATVEQKVAFLRAHQPSFATLRIGVRMLPGTPVARVALQEGRIQTESQSLHPTFYIAETVRPWLVDRLQAEADQNPRWTLM